MMPPAAAPALLLVIAGPAGSGKTTLCERLVAEVPGVERVITSTTRAPRVGEAHGRDYFFLADPEFDRLQAQGAFLEWARVHGSERRYGTLRGVIDEKLAQRIDLCMNIDVQGVAQVRRVAAGDPRLAQRLVTIFVLPPHLDTLRERLAGRGKDDAAEIERRMETARREMAEWMHFDFCIRSTSKEADFATLRAIFTAEKHRVARLR